MSVPEPVPEMEPELSPAVGPVEASSTYPVPPSPLVVAEFVVAGLVVEDVASPCDVADSSETFDPGRVASVEQPTRRVRANPEALWITAGVYNAATPSVL